MSGDGRNYRDSEDYPHAELTERIIASGIKVHTELGPGFVEGIYERALVHELNRQGMKPEYQTWIPVFYDGVEVGRHRLDVVVDGLVLLELKAVEGLAAIHEAQLLSTLKAAKCRIGLLINFNVKLLKHGIRRVINPYFSDSH